MLKNFIKRLKNPYFYTAIAGLIYLILRDTGVVITEAHFLEYTSVIAILLGVYVDPSTPGFLDRVKNQIKGEH